MSDNTGTAEQNFDAEERKRKADAAKPMSSAPMKYDADGNVAWDDMWDSFCVLASAGGPSHRGTMLYADESSDVNSPEYIAAQDEIIRGIFLVSGLTATPHSPGWIAVDCNDVGMAEWVADNGRQENVQCRSEGTRVLVPCGANFTVKGEVKNVVTVIAKTTHYWADHIPSDMKSTMVVEQALDQFASTIKRLFGKK